MKVKVFVSTIILVALSILNISNASAAAPVALADSAYAAEDYHEAIKLYKESIKENGTSPTVLYNLGNAYYRVGDLGHAIIYYERALKLDPSFDDARANLEFAKTRIADMPEDDSSFLNNLYQSILNWCSPNAWAWWSFICFALVILCIAMYAFSPVIMVRKTGFFGGIVMVLVTIFVLTLGFNSARNMTRDDYAVVTVPSTNLCSAPRAPKDKTEKVVPIHEGTKLQIVDSIATPDDPASKVWYDVKINNSTRAWVRGSDVERI